jgi:hypothetical protein
MEKKIKKEINKKFVYLYSAQLTELSKLMAL